MALSGLFIAVNALLAVAVFGQTQAPVTSGCTNERYETGNYLAAHEKECNAYYSCNRDRGTIMMCSHPLCFNPILEVCDWSWNTICPQMAYKKGQIINVKHPCGQSYYSLDGTGSKFITKVNDCPPGLYFQENQMSGSEPCGPNFVANTPFCMRSSGNKAVDPRVNCTFIPDENNPCNYKRVENGIVSIPYACGVGTEWNPAVCTCTASERCFPSNISDIIKGQDLKCRPSLYSNFQDNRTVMLSDKFPTPSFAVAVSFSGQGVQFINGHATVVNTGATVVSFMYNYYYVNNQPSLIFCHHVRFRCNGSQNFLLFSNSKGNSCKPTQVAYCYCSSTSITCQVTASGTNICSLSGEVTNQANSTVTIPINSPQDVVGITSCYNQMNYVVGRNYGPSGNTPGPVITAPPTVNLGDCMAYNECGFLYGGSPYTNVEFWRIAYYEGCANLNIALNM